MSTPRTEYLKTAVDRMICGLYQHGNYALRDDMQLRGAVSYGPDEHNAVAASFAIETCVNNEDVVAMAVTVALA